MDRDENYPMCKHVHGGCLCRLAANTHTPFPPPPSPPLPPPHVVPRFSFTSSCSGRVGFPARPQREYQLGNPL
ncbi:hypothetical protein E2C01_004805 [Portunus trituberculatus]|uniref:Uncharacterized protein n=1 Tax=Portunus trituberculatus TaxID=210409 RepID=A0A5B7CSM6_PORTR|nr:hypothetical protein [Portunus trituberculatus]